LLTIIEGRSTGLCRLAFSRKVQAVLAEPESERLLSSASIFEVAVKSAKGLPPMQRQHGECAVEDLNLTIVSFASKHAWRVSDLPAHHADPFARMLIATALTEDVPAVASDRRFKNYRDLRVIW